MRRIEGLLRTYFIDALTPLQGKRSYPNVTNNQGGVFVTFGGKSY